MVEDVFSKASDTLGNLASKGRALIQEYDKPMTTPFTSKSDREHQAQAKQMTEQKDAASTAKATASFAHSQTPRTSQRAQSRRAGTAKEYKPGQ